MEAERRKELVLAAAVAVLALVAYRLWPGNRPAAGADTASNVRGTSTRRSTAGGGATTPSAPEVHLSALDQHRPPPAESERNLFRFKTKPPPPPPLVRPGGPGGTGRGVPVVPTGPPPPPPLPPMPFKFIGVLEQGPGKPAIAVLSDSRGNVFHGVEGETIEGRYKILRVGVESIEMSYLDGRGRQTIRLTG